MRKKNNTGPKTLLDKEMFREIEKLVKSGEGIESIAKTLNLNPATLYQWKRDDNQGIEEAWQQWRREMLLKNVEKNWHELTQSDDESIRLQANKFIAETLGKKWYSKNEGNTINIVMPQPILDLGKVVSSNTIESIDGQVE